MADERDEIIARAHAALRYEFAAPAEKALAQDVLAVHGWLLDLETEVFDAKLEGRYVGDRGTRQETDGR